MLDLNAPPAAKQPIAPEGRPEVSIVGHPPPSVGTPEHAARAFAADGEAVIDGAWAMVVIDRTIGRLTAGVDALGRHALYWAIAGNQLWVADDPAPLLAQPAIPKTLDEIALANHLIGYAWDEARTPHAAIRRLPAGHRLDAHHETGVRTRRWWNPNQATIGPLLDREPPQMLAERWYDALRKAVADRLPREAAPPPAGGPAEAESTHQAATRPTSGDPFGVMLSGGLDSTSVAALARASRPTARIHAASYGFRSLAACDESRWSQAVATRCDLELSFVDTEAHPLLDDPSAYVPSPAEPFCAWSRADQELLAGLAAAGTRTVLTGHGGDLLIGGSTLALASRVRRGDPRAVLDAWNDRERRDRGTGLARWFWDQGLAPLLRDPASAWARMPWQARPPSSSTRRSFGQATWQRTPTWISPGLARRTGLLEGRPSRPPAPPSFDEPARQALFGALCHPGAVNRAIRWLDRIASPLDLRMAHPFLDRHLAELALRLPPAQTYTRGRRKGVHRAALNDHLPQTVLSRRRKTDLSAFHDMSLRRPGAIALVTNLFAQPRGVDLGLTDARGLQRLHEHFLAGKGGRLGDALWAAITLELWLQEHA